MPASVYRMAGRPHPTESAATVPAPELAAEVIAVPQENVEISPAEVIVEALQVAEPAAASEPAAATDTSYPAWDPNWTKAKLLEIATSLNLSVTIDNTKAQIIAALTEATSV